MLFEILLDCAFLVFVVRWFTNLSSVVTTGWQLCYNMVSNLQQACKSTCSQITDMTKPEEDQSEEDLKKRLSVEVC